MTFHQIVIYLFFIIPVATSCTAFPSIEERLQMLDTVSERVVIRNTLAIPNLDGHIQGVQYYEEDGRGYYLLSGSSDSVAYYVVADAEERQVIATDSFFRGALRHAGGFQIADRYLAVGVEDNRRKDRSTVGLYELAGPANKKLKLLKTIERRGPEKRFTSGCVALTKQGDHFLLAVGNWDTKNIEFYTLPFGQVHEPQSQFEEVFSFDTKTTNRSNWVDTSWQAYQNINFLHDQNELYLIGTAKKDTTDYEIIDLYHIQSTSTATFDLQKAGHHIFLNPDTTTTFKWGGGIYQDPSGAIHIFSTNRNIRDSLIIDTVVM